MVVLWKNDCIRAKKVVSGTVVVFGHCGCIRAKCMYSVKNACIRAKVFFIREKCFFSGKVVVIGQCGCIRSKWLYLGKSCCNPAKVFVSGKGGSI